MAFHDRLRQARIRAEMTQEQAANLLGIAKSTYSGYETGKSEPSMNTIANLMRIFNVSPGFLWQDEIEGQFKNRYPDSSIGLEEYAVKTDDEIELLRAYRSLTPNAKQAVLLTVRAFAGNPSMRKEGHSAPAM